MQQASEVEALAAELMTEGYADAEDAAVATSTGWRVETLADAEFALRRLGELRREEAQNAGLLKRLIENLKAKHERLNAKTARGIAFFEGHLRLYAEAHRSELLGSGRKKSRDLHFGSIGWRVKPASLEVKDESAFLAWCKRQGAAFVRTKEEPVIAAVKEHVGKSGEVPDGVELVEAKEEFQAKPEVES